MVNQLYEWKPTPEKCAIKTGISLYPANITSTITKTLTEVALPFPCHFRAPLRLQIYLQEKNTR